MEIPNPIYIKFYEVLKHKFLKLIPPKVRSEIEDSDVNFWKENIPSTRNDTYFELAFGIVTNEPKHFYKKYRDAINDKPGNRKEKDALMIHVLEKFLHLKYPVEITLPDELDVDLKAKVLMQVFLESYAFDLLSKYPQFNVYDRIFECFRSESEIEKFQIQNKKNVSTSELENMSETISDDNLPEAIVDVQTKKLSECISNFFMSISNGDYMMALECWSPSWRHLYWKGSLERFCDEWNFYAAVQNLKAWDFKIYDGQFESKKGNCLCFYESVSVMDNKILIDSGKFEAINLKVIDDIYKEERKLQRHEHFRHQVKENYKFPTRLNRYTTLPDYIKKKYTEFLNIRRFHFAVVRFEYKGDKWYIEAIIPLEFKDQFYLEDKLKVSDFTAWFGTEAYEKMARYRKPNNERR